MMPRTLRATALALTFLACKAEGRKPQVPVVERVLVAARALEAGTSLTPADAVEADFPRSVLTRDIYSPKDVKYLEHGQPKLHRSLAKGEPIRHSDMLTPVIGFPGGEAAEQCREIFRQDPQQVALPRRIPPADPDAEVKILVVTDFLVRGSLVDREDVEVRAIQARFLSDAYVRLEDAEWVYGRWVVTSIGPGDVLRFTSLSGWADPRICDWEFEIVGNRWELAGPPDAAKVKCPKGTRRLEGVPRGSEWTPRLPGWAVTCINRQGARHGPWRAWHRLSADLHSHGQYKDGRRDGKWEFFKTPGGPASATENWADGILHGFVENDVERGVYVKGARAGVFRLGGMKQAQFDDGAPAGKWVSEGGDTVEFEDGQIATRAVDGGWPQPVAVAARDISVGERLTKDMKVARDVPARLATEPFVRSNEGTGWPVRTTIKAGWPILRGDLFPNPDQPDPVPLEKKERPAFIPLIEMPKSHAAEEQ